MKKEEFTINNKRYMTLAKCNDIILYIESDYNEERKLIIYASHFVSSGKKLILSILEADEWNKARDILNLLKFNS